MEFVCEVCGKVGSEVRKIINEIGDPIANLCGECLVKVIGFCLLDDDGKEGDTEQ